MIYKDQIITLALVAEKIATQPAAVNQQSHNF